MSQSFFLVNVFISVQSCLCNAHIQKHNVHFLLLSLTESRLFRHLLNSRCHPRRSPFIPQSSCSPAIPLVQPRDWPIPPIQPANSVIPPIQPANSVIPPIKLANSANSAYPACKLGQSRLFSFHIRSIPPFQPPYSANSPCSASRLGQLPLSSL